MIKLALTGSIGMGKSAVAAMFVERGIPMFDADAVVRKLQADHGPMVAAIGAKFPESVTGGVLDRNALASAVLGDPEKLELLESIVHPEVQAARAAFIAAHRDSAALLFDIPLLFETGGETDFDTVITVSAPPEIQRARVLQRPGMTAQKLEAILARQLPDEQKRRRSDFVIDTSSDLSTTAAQVDRILACLGLAGEG